MIGVNFRKLTVHQVVPVTAGVRETALLVRVEVVPVMTRQIARLALNALVESVTTLAVGVRKTRGFPKTWVC